MSSEGVAVDLPFHVLLTDDGRIDVCKYGMNSKCGLIVNSSRAIIYADGTEKFAQVAGQKAKEVQQEMAAYIK